MISVPPTLIMIPITGLNVPACLGHDGLNTLIRVWTRIRIIFLDNPRLLPYLPLRLARRGRRPVTPFDGARRGPAGAFVSTHAGGFGAPPGRKAPRQELAGTGAQKGAPREARPGPKNAASGAPEGGVRKPCSQTSPRARRGRRLASQRAFVPRKT